MDVGERDDGRFNAFSFFFLGREKGKKRAGKKKRKKTRTKRDETRQWRLSYASAGRCLTARVILILLTVQVFFFYSYFNLSLYILIIF